MTHSTHWNQTATTAAAAAVGCFAMALSIVAHNVTLCVSVILGILISVLLVRLKARP